MIGIGPDLALFDLLAFESRLRETIVVAGRPFTSFFVSFNLGGIYETISLSPFGRAPVVFVVSYILTVDISDTVGKLSR